MESKEDEIFIGKATGFIWQLEHSEDYRDHIDFPDIPSGTSL